MATKQNVMETMLADIELIDKYQHGTANTTEKQDVQNRMVNDASFRSLFDDMEVLSEGIRRSGAKSTLDEKLAKLDLTVDDDEEPGTKEIEIDVGIDGPRSKEVLWYHNRIILAVAASVVLLLVAWVAFGPERQVSNSELVAQYFSPYDNENAQTRGEQIGQTDGIIAEAFISYDRGDYQASIPLFVDALQMKEDVDITFYLGNAYLATNDSENAIISFQTVKKAGNDVTGRTDWFLALSYLHNENAEEAIKLLEDVRDHGEAYYAAKAIELLQKIE